MLGSTFRVLTKMITGLYLRGCSLLFIPKDHFFRIFAVLLGVLSFVSFALVFHTTTKTKIYKSAAYQISFAVTSTEKTVNSKDIKRNITNTSAACRLPVLDPFHSSVIRFMEDLGKLRCSGVSYSSFENNVLRVEGEGVVSAQYRKIERTPGNDFGVVLSDPVKLQSTTVATKIPKGKQNMYTVIKRALRIIYFVLCEKHDRSSGLQNMQENENIAIQADSTS